ncbi:DUF2441 domain-containing protein [Anaerosinus gibii]|uniref:DUF2441 domain-containing protein n=1 Tax=Selenobaculum gibii TaxID=3054208 RepID=A0A9Y2ES96_9FIRM|nr:DUF2441 domain-containing protein [Selenobaculum gbiensis]WIW70638.1 DUF2441 domain-containing protein [Selenobaculum gbiensis]
MLIVIEYIQDKEFFHISVPKFYSQFPEWSLNETRFIGKTTNPFFSYYDKTSYQVLDKTKTTAYPFNKIANVMNEIISGRTQIPHDLPNFYHCNPNRCFSELYSYFKDYLLLTREWIYEEVRKESFPHLPSRQKGLWVIPINESLKASLTFWEKNLVSNENAKFLKLKLTGKLHLTSEEFLLSDSLSLDQFRQTAFKYWLGCNNPKNPEQLECIFEGFASVTHIYDSLEEINF